MKRVKKRTEVNKLSLIEIMYLAGKGLTFDLNNGQIVRVVSHI